MGRVYLEQCTELSFFQLSLYSAISLINDRRYLYLGYVTHSTLLTPVALRAAGSNDAFLRLCLSFSLGERWGGFAATFKTLSLPLLRLAFCVSFCQTSHLRIDSLVTEEKMRNGIHPCGAVRMPGTEHCVPRACTTPPLLFVMRFCRFLSFR